MAVFPQQTAQRTLLLVAAGKAYDTRWLHTRSSEVNWSQCSKAIQTLTALGESYLEDISQDVLQEAVQQWAGEGLAYWTIRRRLNCLRAIGVAVPQGLGPKKQVQLKWWLDPAAEARMTEHLLSHTQHDNENEMLADFIQWTCLTGLRVEESLRLTFREVQSKSVTVPRTKVAGTQVTLALSSQAAAIIDRRSGGEPFDRVFPFKDYEHLWSLWQTCRRFLGVTDVPTATLKALRRSAVRHLHIELGLPLDMVRDYLGHSDIKVTEGYLKLIGGYRMEEMRRYLK